MPYLPMYIVCIWRTIMSYQKPSTNFYIKRGTEFTITPQITSTMRLLEEKYENIARNIC